MKTVTAAMTALFAQRKWYTAKLFTFTLADGTVLRYCSGDIDLPLGGDTYSCGGSTGPYFERSDNKAKTHWGIGTGVDTLTFDVIPGSGTVEGFPFNLAVRYGLFDGAELTYQRVNMPTPGATSPGAITMFGGRVAECSYSNSLLSFVVNSHLELLNIQMPRNLYQAGCLNTLFDASCTLNPASFSSSGTVAASPASTAYSFPLSGAAAGQAAGYFNLGKVSFTTGRNTGIVRAVQSHVGGSPPLIAIFPPLPFAPAMGDAFTATAGCDKTITTCTGKFSNLVNYRGMDFTPQAETAL